MIKKSYHSLEITIFAFGEEVIHTSEMFTPNEAPDVYEPDPFTQD